MGRHGRTASLVDLSLGIDDEATRYENIVTRGLLLGFEPEAVRARLDDIAAFTELGDYLRMPAHSYSAGMRLRLGFAVCTAFQPDILLMDEWLGVGDRAFAERALRRLDRLVENAAILVLASQETALLERLHHRRAPRRRQRQGLRPAARRAARIVTALARDGFAGGGR